MIADAATVSRVAAGTPTFSEICERFLGLEARKAADEACVNFEQAQLIRDARVRLKVPIAVIGEALRLSPQSINAYRNVAERIDEPLCRELIGERLHAIPLFSWSVIAQVARLENHGDRMDLIGKIRECSWRTRDVEAYVSSRRGDARARCARREGQTPGRGVAHEPRPGERARMGGTATGEEAADVTSCMRDLGSRMLRLVHANASDAARPTLVIIVTEVLARVLREAAHALATAHERAPSRDLEGARDALTRCLESVARARDTLTESLAEAEPLELASDGVARRRDVESLAPEESARP
jgi:hypothetical protein